MSRPDFDWARLEKVQYRLWPKKKCEVDPNSKRNKSKQKNKKDSTIRNLIPVVSASVKFVKYHPGARALPC